LKSLVVIQARMGSTRLPGKMLLPLGRSCLLDYSVSRSRAMGATMGVLVATSLSPMDDGIAHWCEAHDVPCFRGAEDDVLGRFADAARQYAPDYIVRVTGDNPFIDYEMARRMLQEALRRRADIVRVAGECPLGLAAEVVSYSTLLQMCEAGTEARHREHVTPYAYEHPERFSIHSLECPDGIRAEPFRLTIDTEEDYRLGCAVADAFPGERLVAAADVIRFLRERPELAAINRSVIQKPVV
jgi:spore coat polysaccharide biosynthesis protein SpsF